MVFYTRAAWLLVALLVSSYLLQLCEQSELTETDHALARVIALVEEARLERRRAESGALELITLDSPSTLSPPSATLPPPTATATTDTLLSQSAEHSPSSSPASRLSTSLSRGSSRETGPYLRLFGGVFYEWCVRFYENRAFEAAFLFRPGSLHVLVARGAPLLLLLLLLAAAASGALALREALGGRLSRAEKPPSVRTLTLGGGWRWGEGAARGVEMTAHTTAADAVGGGERAVESGGERSEGAPPLSSRSLPLSSRSTPLATRIGRDREVITPEMPTRVDSEGEHMGREERRRPRRVGGLSLLVGGLSGLLSTYVSTRLAPIRRSLRPGQTPPPMANRICNTRIFGVPLPFSARNVGAATFVGSLVLYFSSPDDFFFLFVAFGQVVETGSFRSCGPVLFFCFLFCFAEAANASRLARHDAELNLRTCTVIDERAEAPLPPAVPRPSVPPPRARRVAWQSVRHGDQIRLLSGETPPCDVLVTRAHGSVRAGEKDLTGESKPLSKRALGGRGGDSDTPYSLRVSRDADEVLLLRGRGGGGSHPQRLDASYQLFRGTSVVLSTGDGSQPWVEGIAIRCGHECKMYRECAVAAQPPSQLLELMSSVGVKLVLVLSLLAYDNTLSVFRLGHSNGHSVAKVFFGNVIYTNTMVPMSLKQVVLIACSLQAAWFVRTGVLVNAWHAVARLAELATQGPAVILTDKTGTLTVNEMLTKVVARVESVSGAGLSAHPTSRWAFYSETPPSRALPTSPDEGASARAPIQLLTPRRFPTSGSSELPPPMRAAAFSWVAATSEVPGQVGEAEEASFIARLPGRLLSNLSDSRGGTNLAFTLPASSGGIGGGTGAPHVSSSGIASSGIAPPIAGGVRPPPSELDSGEEVHRLRVRLQARRINHPFFPYVATPFLPYVQKIMFLLALFCVSSFRSTRSCASRAPSSAACSARAMGGGGASRPCTRSSRRAPAPSSRMPTPRMGPSSICSRAQPPRASYSDTLSGKAPCVSGGTASARWPQRRWSGSRAHSAMRRRMSTVGEC